MAEGKFSFHFTVKSQSFSWPVSLGYAIHKSFPSGKLFFFPFPPCPLLPYLATAFLFDFLEAPSLADNVFPLLGETGSLDETEYSGKNFFPGTQTFIMEKVLGIIQNDYSFPSRRSHKGICLRFSL